MQLLRARLIPTLTATLALLFAACRQAPETAPATSPDAPAKITLAAIPKATAPAYWKAAEAGARRAAAEFNVTLQWQAPLDDSPVADQIALFNTLAASGVKGILLAPGDAQALVPHVRAATQRGIPIALFDSPLDAQPGTDYINLSATDHQAAGATAAKTLEALIGRAPVHAGQVLVIRSTADSASIRLREEGFDTALAAFPALKNAAPPSADGTPAGAQRVAETLLGGYIKNHRLELAGIFAPDQPTAEAAYHALKSLRDQGVEVTAEFVAFDDSPLLLQGLQSGVIQALVVQNPEKMGYLGVKSLVAHLQGRPLEPFVDTGVTIKTKANTTP